MLAPYVFTNLHAYYFNWYFFIITHLFTYYTFSIGRGAYSWKYRITNVEVRTGQQTIDNILRERQLCWPGDVLRMDQQHLPQQALYWQVPGYKRGPGRPRANWRSTVNKDLQKMGFTLEEAEVAALDRHGVWPIVSSWMRDESRSLE